MPIVLISCRYLTLMYKEQRFIKNVYGISFDISKIILRVKSFLCSENSLRMFVSVQETCRKEVSFRRKCEEKLNWQLTT